MLQVVLQLILALAEGMAATPASPGDLKHISSEKPANDPRPRIVADIRKIVQSF